MDPEEEVIFVAVVASPALDDLGGGVDTFDDAGIERMTAVRLDSTPEALRGRWENTCKAAIPLYLAGLQHRSSDYLCLAEF